LLWASDPAEFDARFTVQGGPGVWYASSQEQAAWAELFRHFTGLGIDPFEVLRRAGAARVEDLSVLDLTDPAVREAVGLVEADLLGDGYSRTQQIALAAVAAGFDGILAPSAALPGRTTLAVFPRGMAKVSAVREAVRTAPPRLRMLSTRVRRRSAD
jgi:RES domain-containing protein